jgi:hypothetical protein
MKNDRAVRMTVYFEDEAPRLGAGLRIVRARVGWKWAHVTDAFGRKARIRRAVWDRITNAKRS